MKTYAFDIKVIVDHGDDTYESMEIEMSDEERDQVLQVARDNDGDLAALEDINPDLYERIYDEAEYVANGSSSMESDSRNRFFSEGGGYYDDIAYCRATMDSLRVSPSETWYRQTNS